MCRPEWRRRWLIVLKEGALAAYRDMRAKTRLPSARYYYLPRADDKAIAGSLA